MRQVPQLDSVMFNPRGVALRSSPRPRGTAAFLFLAVTVGIVVGLAAAAPIGAVSGMARLVVWLGEETGVSKVAALEAVPLDLPLA